VFVALDEHVTRRRERMRRVHATLVQLSSTAHGARHATVLHLVYGPPLRHHPFGFSAEVAPLALMTPTAIAIVEKASQAMRDELATRPAETAQRIAASSTKLLYALRARTKALREERSGLDGAAGECRREIANEMRAVDAQHEALSRALLSPEELESIAANAPRVEAYPRQAVEDALKAPGGAIVRSRIAHEADAILAAASEAYDRAARGEDDERTLAGEAQDVLHAMDANIARLTERAA
jgi:hypothetical protein